MASKPNKIPDLLPINFLKQQENLGDVIQKDQIIEVNSGKINLSTGDPFLPICRCPQQCQRLLPISKWKNINRLFGELGDVQKQNAFLQKHIDIKNINFDSKRRISYIYYMPWVEDGASLDLLSSTRTANSVEVCQKAFMKAFAITEKRLRGQRERCLPRPDHGIVGLKQKEFIDRCLNGDRPTNNGNGQPSDLSLNGNRPSDLSNGKPSDQSLNGNRQTSDLSRNGNRQSSDAPMDLSMVSSPTGLDADKIYQFADILGLPRSEVSGDMLEMYETMVRKNMEKTAKQKSRKRRKKEEADARQSIWDQVQTLDKKGSMHQSHTMNNGAVTITPITPVQTVSSAQDVRADSPTTTAPDFHFPQPPPNQDMSLVNAFFQNQLWQA